LIERSQMAYLLINSPLSDPTAPYHSISYLVGQASTSGFTSHYCADVNIDMLNYMAQPKQMAQLLDTAAHERARIETAESISRADELTYRCALNAVGLKPDSAESAIALLQDPDSFFDYSKYRQATMVLRRWTKLFCLDSLPGAFDGFALNMNGPFNLGSIDDLSGREVPERLAAPFAAYFDGPFMELLTARPWSVVGISINYVSQLPFGIYMCRQVRAHCPDAILCVGGTEVSDDVKYLRDPGDIWRLFPGCDAAVVGEGESAFVEILEAARLGSRVPIDQPGVLTRESTRLLGNVRYEDIGRLPAPRYDIWDWSDYWSPEPVIYYSPTRGCYWDKCTFCDYGLNTDRPTSPSRERPAGQVATDLQEISHIGRTVYFAVDAMSPAYIRRLCQQLVEARIGTRWAAELRLERSFPRQQFGSLLYAAGCRAISFGFESGSQRILDLIRKGVDLSLVPGILNELAGAGIAAQMMGFIGFPTETQEEALSTYNFLSRHDNLWTTAGIDDFVLTKGSIVAKVPQDFGIAKLVMCDGDDIVRSLIWVDHIGQVNGPGTQRTEEIETAARQLHRFRDDRPFVGGIDSTHSLLYFARYGPSLIPSIRSDHDLNALVVTQCYETPFADVETFLDFDDLKQLHASHRLQGKAVGYPYFANWLAELSTSRSSNGYGEYAALEIYPSGGFLTIDETHRSSAYTNLKQLLLRSSGMI
jgi:anaerobic magnesium-protoporphyrin IX monomethyl ester cyclase